MATKLKIVCIYMAFRKEGKIAEIMKLLDSKVYVVDVHGVKHEGIVAVKKYLTEPAAEPTIKTVKHLGEDIVVEFTVTKGYILTFTVNARFSFSSDLKIASIVLSR